MSGFETPMTHDETTIRKAVRDHYAQLAQTRKSTDSCCCPQSSPPSEAPPEASQIYDGCGSPIEAAGIREGEIVVDLGSGGGYDVFRASKLVGQTGCVIGIDATPEMIWRARETARKHNFSNVEFRLGEIEHIPLDSDSADVVVSNCVINLAPDKLPVFREALRILKPGGRFVVSDVVAQRGRKIDRSDLKAWAACVAGALPESEYQSLIKEAGFTDTQVTKRTPSQDDKSAQSCCSSGIDALILTATKPRNPNS